MYEAVKGSREDDVVNKKSEKKSGKKDSQLVLRLDQEERDAFVKLCKQMDTSAAREIRAVHPRLCQGTWRRQRLKDTPRHGVQFRDHRRVTLFRRGQDGIFQRPVAQVRAGRRARHQEGEGSRPTSERALSALPVRVRMMSAMSTAPWSGCQLS